MFFDLEEMKKLYLEEGYSINDLAIKFNCSRIPIRKFLKENNIVKDEKQRKEERRKKYIKNWEDKPEEEKQEKIKKIKEKKKSKTDEEKQEIINKWKQSWNRKTKEEKSEIKKKIWANRTEEERQKIKDKLKENWDNKTEEEKQKIKEKYKKTCLEKYDCENPFQNEEIKRKIKQIISEKYNCEHPLQNEEIKEKVKETWENKTGEEKQEIKNKIRESWNNKTEEEKQEITDKWKKNWDNKTDEEKKEIKEKTRRTCLEKYDCENPFQNEEIKRKIKQTFTEHFEQGLIKPSFTSKPEMEIKEFLKELGFKEGVDFKKNKSVLKGEELDIYLPNYNIAIEFNGVYYHRFPLKERSYHYNKLSQCREKGIDLINIWEDHWKNKKEIIKDIIKHRLKKSTCHIQARKCEISEVDNKTYKDFCNQYHLQGYRPATVRLGLYCNNDLKQIASFNKCNAFHKEEWEWIRGCVSSNNLIVGGANRLFKYFVKNWKPQSILCFSDNNYFNGNGYQKIGFELVDEVKYDKFYVEPNSFKRIARNPFKYQELMEKVKNNKLFLCYGAGSKKFVWGKTQKKNK